MAARRTYPRVTVENALFVAKALKDRNGGNPWRTEEVANALGIARTNNRFFYQTAASRDYGFTVGTRDAAEISLTELGRQAVYPSGPESEYQAQTAGLSKHRCLQSSSPTLWRKQAPGHAVSEQHAGNPIQH